MEGWKKTRKWTIGAINKLGYGDIAKMKVSERADLAQYLTTLYKRRMAQAKRSGEIPYGLEKLQRSYDQVIYSDSGTKMTLADKNGYNIGDNITVTKNGMVRLAPALNRMTYVNQHLMGYIMMMKTGLSWESSTVTGWKSVKNKQDIMLFGGHYEKKGKKKVFVPNMTMDRAQRKMFWDAVDELRKRGTTALDYEHSEPLTETDFTTFFSEGKVDWTDLTSVTQALEKFLNGDSLSFPEYAPGDIGDPFGQGEEFGKDGLSNDDSL